MPLVSRKASSKNLIVQDDEPQDKETVWIDSGDSPRTINIGDGTNFNAPAFKINGTPIPVEALI